MDSYSRDRSRSRSPVRSGTSDSRRSRYAERNQRENRRGDYRSSGRRPAEGYERDGFSRERGRDRSQGHRPDRYGGRNGGYGNSGYESGRYGSGAPRGSRYDDSAAKGDYGPKLARELDSPYDEKVNRNYAHSIFIGNLTYNTTPEDLKDYFGKIGEVRRADIITSRGHHRGMGTVEFNNTTDVDTAIKECDGAFLNGRAIFVRQDNPPPGEISRPANTKSSAPVAKRSHDQGFEVFVAQLPFSVNWQELKDMFKPCGEVLHADVATDRDGKSRGFGIVYMATEAEQAEAIRQWSGVEYKGRVLDVKEGKATVAAGGDTYIPRHPRGDPPVPSQPTAINIDPSTVTGGGHKNAVVFCGNMPPSTTESDLYDLFGSIATVVKAELLLNREGEETKSSYCQFELPHDAELCISKLNNYSYGDHELNVSYAKY